MNNIINLACHAYERCDRVRKVGNCNHCPRLHDNDFKDRLTAQEQEYTAYNQLVKQCYYYSYDTPRIKNVIFNEPATIVFWEDGSKTVVKCQDGDIFDPEKGLTMAITKKVYGNKGNYCEEIKKWVDPYYEKMEAADTAFDDFLEKLRKGCEDINARLSLGFINPAELRSNFGLIKEDIVTRQEMIDLIHKDDDECQE